eukprot:4924773-Pyramimonas_sp.AAC.1
MSDSAICRGCGAVEEHGRRVCYRCPATNHQLLEEEEFHPMPEELIKYRESVLEHGILRTPVVSDDCYD